ncbi:MAG TPA: hypothetical protein PKA28_06420 [Methylomusa anaerophila]|uniref:PspA/IM30 family protein n=1 Tax=Methylomusa anaerophila TaxID=1930071 RepID=A0A348AGK7_9FIRM|nr:hypothetical protein [Methylomusa anaerophila]BBB90205.1 hypothetical protein MAMMFC1_00853 [Methylomusa anaerophila]HML88069.1 hypothetical protein [Methylomusa anaerophila]
MPIDQVGLNNLLANFFPKNNLTVLREYHAGLQKKLAEKAFGNKEMLAKQDNNNANTDIKQIVAELQAADKQIRQAIYEEETRKLEIDRLKREEAAAENLRKREKALARHERVLDNASMGKLLSAASKITHKVGAGMVISLNSPHGLPGKNDEIERDLKESVEFGIAAAEVARRRKNSELKANSEEAAYKKATKEKAQKRNLNITI